MENLELDREGKTRRFWRSIYRVFLSIPFAFAATGYFVLFIPIPEKMGFQSFLLSNIVLMLLAGFWAKRLIFTGDEHIFSTKTFLWVTIWWLVYVLSAYYFSDTFNPLNPKQESVLIEPKEAVLYIRPVLETLLAALFLVMVILASLLIFSRRLRLMVK